MGKGKGKIKSFGMPLKYTPPKKKPQMSNADMQNGADATESMFSMYSVPELLGGIEFMVNELKRRGVKVVDYENKKRVLEMIRPIGNKVYFLAAEDEDI